jgi:hypothetical protein
VRGYAFGSPEHGGEFHRQDAKGDNFSASDLRVESTQNGFRIALDDAQ